MEHHILLDVWLFSSKYGLPTGRDHWPDHIRPYAPKYSPATPFVRKNRQELEKNMSAKDIDLDGLPTEAPAACPAGRLRFADVSSTCRH